MAELFKILINITIYSSILILVVLSFKAIVNKKSSVKYASFLWLIVLTRLLFFFTVDSPFHFDTLMNTGNEPETVETVSAPNNQNSEIPFEYTLENNYAYNQEDVYSNSNIVNENTTFTELNAAQTNRIDFAEFIKSINIWLVLSIVWIAGVIFQAVKSTISVIRFENKIRTNRKELSHDIEGVLSECTNLVRLKAKVKIYECECVNRPITYGLISPSILLPTGFREKTSNNKMRLILLHEVCHIRRKDILKNYLWQIAKTVHWFNPLVLFACKSFQEDLELSCDEMVLNYLNKRDKYEYSQSLLDVMRLSKKYIRLPIALSFFENKNTLRKRVENVVEPKKMSIRLTFTTIVLILVLLFTCFTTACQPTPENTIIQNKANTEMDEIIENSNPDNTQEAAQAQTETYQNAIQLLDGKLNINIDATVYTQNNNWSIVQASTNSLSNDDVRKMSSIIMNNQVLYNYTNEKTKQQLMDRFISYKSKWASGDRAISEEEYNQNCAGYEIDIERAPETITYTMANYDTPTEYPDISGIPVEMYYFMNDPINSEFEESIKFQSMEQGYEIFYQKILPEQDEYIETSQEQLISIAQLYLNKLGIYNMTVVKIEENNPEFLTQEDIEFIGEENPTNEIFYRLYLTRDIGGNTVTYDLKDYANNNMGGPRPAGTDILVYTPCPQGESVFMVITNNEVTNFKYTTPMTEYSVLSDNVAIKSVEEIMPIFTQYMEFNNAWTIASGQSTVVDLASMNTFNSDLEVVKIEFDIDTIKLGYMRVKDKNSNINSYLFIPVWDFYGTTIIYYSDGTTSQFERPQTSYLTINAIDGTVLNRYIGY